METFLKYKYLSRREILTKLTTSGEAPKFSHQIQSKLL